MGIKRMDQSAMNGRVSQNHHNQLVGFGVSPWGLSHRSLMQARTPRSSWMDDVFQEVTRDFFAVPLASRPHALRSEETDQAYIVEMDLPGFRLDEVRVEAEKLDERIHVRLLAEKLNQGSGSYSRARVERQLVLPGDVDESRIEAAVQDGVLSLVLPKKQEAEPENKTWAIKVGDSVTGLLGRFKTQA
jgi:HSP20 family molecular chaperone IbpA